MAPNQAEWMRPADYEAAIKATPVAIVPWGAFEWHGPHMPLGLDATKAHALALKMGDALGGGVVFPPVYVGHRTVKQALKMPHCIDCKPATVMNLMDDTLTALDESGFRVIVIVAGHYGSTHRSVLTCAINAWIKERGEGAPQVWQASDYQIAAATEEFAHWDNSDHAGMWETSLFMALAPDSVDLGLLEDRPDGASREDQGIMGIDPKAKATRELGDRIVEVIVELGVKKIREMLG